MLLCTLHLRKGVHFRATYTTSIHLHAVSSCRYRNDATHCSRSSWRDIQVYVVYSPATSESTEAATILTPADWPALSDKVICRQSSPCDFKEDLSFPKREVGRRRRHHIFHRKRRNGGKYFYAILEFWLFFYSCFASFFFHCLYAMFVLKCKAVNTSLVDLITDLYLVLRNSTLFRLFKTDRQNNV